ncbi:hypothetical protein, partial [Mesorhizobium japonicum]|uniref:hypothetical protein n=1 Tax=Mesorhizobium japonicum TaxID=2066070 RepID=UPI003B5B9043
MADLNGAGFSLMFDPLALTLVASLSPEGRARRSVGFSQSENIDPTAFDQPANFSPGANIALAQPDS